MTGTIRQPVRALGRQKQNMQTTTFKKSVITYGCVAEKESLLVNLQDYAINITWQQVKHVGELKQATLLFNPDKKHQIFSHYTCVV